MRRNLRLLFGILPAMVMAACGSGRYYASGSDPTESAMALDEVTNGLASEVPATLPFDLSAGGWEDPATNPMAGAFYNDGDGDIRSRSESFFGRTAQLDDVTNVANEPGEPEAAPVERLLIYQGQIAVEVARPEESIAAFLAQVKAWGGYMQSQVGNRVTVRLPAKLFEDAFEHLRGAGRVLSEQRKADDVTEEYLDLEIRLDNARTSRDRLLEILEKADKVDDILKIEAQLRRLTDEIERMEGRRKFLADQVALATLQADFQAVAEPPPVKRRRQPSRFRWINLVGAERIMEDF